MYPVAVHYSIDVLQLTNLTSGGVAIGIAQQLDLAITLSPRLYAKDIEIALKIIRTLFEYESQQNSSTLVSSRTKEFAKVRKLKSSAFLCPTLETSKFYIFHYSTT